MQVTGYKTHIITPNEDLITIIEKYIPTMPNKSILAITSKIVSICQGKLIPKDAVTDKLTLIEEEADLYLKGHYEENHGITLTIKNNILIPTAGIDESNSNDHYILYPDNIQKEAEKIWQHLREKSDSKEIGVLITDSHTTPLRRGVTGIALGWCGFEPLSNYIGKPDIFGRLLKVTQTNILDALAAAAVFEMGEGNERIPLVLIENLSKVEFQKAPPTDAEIQSIAIDLNEDIYSPLLTSVSWISKRPKS